jgi:hypothetical protein
MDLGRELMAKSADLRRTADRYRRLASVITVGIARIAFF